MKMLMLHIPYYTVCIYIIYIIADFFIKSKQIFRCIVNEQNIIACIKQWQLAVAMVQLVEMTQSRALQVKLATTAFNIIMKNYYNE